MTGAERIAAERQRQMVVHKFSEEQDDAQKNSELVRAAMCYADLGRLQIKYNDPFTAAFAPDTWPWEAKWWNPSTNAIRNMEKAGALIAAEIDRVQRLRGEV